MASAVASDRYRVLERIGEGGAGVVYKVEDRAAGAIRAMKVIPRASGASALRGEFLALARLRCDNIVQVHDYGLTDADHDYFTMDYVEGPALLDAITGADHPAFYPVIGGVLRALACLHARGMVHADIKPSNILLDGEALARAPAEAPRLVDFGFAARATDPDAGAARGTFPYAAPEVYAGRLDARSDLYALGVVLYELATRRKPFPGDDVATVLAAQRRGAPADPRELVPDLPDGLAELIAQLLDPLPGVRPQTTDEVLARVNDLGGTDFAVAASRPIVDLGSAMFGRDRDLRELEALWDQAREGRGAGVLLCGEEGIGKSRLLAELTLHAQLTGGRAVSLSCTAVADLEQALRAALGERAPRAATAVPLPVDAGGSRYARAEQLADAVLHAAEATPMLVAIDDAHAADRGTADLLAYLARAASSGKLLLAMAARHGSLSHAARRRASSADDGAALAQSPYGELRPGAQDAAVAQLTAAVEGTARGRRFDLPPLDRHSIFRALETATDAEVARALAAEIHRSSGGNPAHAQAVLAQLVASGALRRDRGQWRLDADLGPLPMPADAVATALARADALAAPDRAVLDAAAVLGEHFPAAALIVIAGEKADVDAALAEAATARLVLGDPGTGWVHFAHREVAAALYEHIEPERRAALHAAAAAALEALGDGVPPESIAVHYLALGASERAIDAAERAAASRARARDYHGALRWYERARPLADDRGDALRAARLDERTGELRAIVGDAAGACDDLERAHGAAADDPELQVRVARRWGRLLRKRGSGEQAQDVLMEALELARRNQLPAEQARVHLALGEVLMYRAQYKAAMEHAIAGYLVARSHNDLPAAAELGRLRASIEVYQGNAQAALAHLEQSIEDAQAAEDEAVLAEIQFATGRASIHAGDYTRARLAYERAIPIFERLGQVEEVARSLNNLGAAGYFAGDWTLARDSWERFRDLCERLDDKAELVNALNNLGSLYRDMGQLADAETTLDRAAEVASLVGHAHMAAMILANRGEVKLRQDDRAGARVCYERALAQFRDIGAQEDVCETLRRLCELDLALGRVTEALDRAIDTARQAQRCGARLEEAILHRVAATALRQQGDLESASWFCDRARDKLVELGARFEIAKTDLEAAEIATARGDGERAQELLADAIETFAALGARTYLKRARSRQRSRPAAGTISLAGREALLEVAQAASELELDKLLEVVLDRIIEVTGFDRGFILLLDRDGRPSERMRRARPDKVGFRASDAEFSGSIVQRVAGTGEAISVSDVGDEADLRDQASVVALGLRRVMCAPMRWRGRVVGVAYVDSTQLPRDDGAADLALFEALAAQAGLAIENARLAAEDRRKTELMGVLAHEIRNPLSGILGFSKLTEVEAAEMKPQTRELFEHVQRDGMRLKRLVDNVIELVRHEAGAVEWSMSALDVGAIAQDVRASFQAASGTRGVDLVLEVEPQAGAALGNADRIAQVITNLVGNAVKFSPEGGAVTITVRREQVRDDDPLAPTPPASEPAAWAPLPARSGVRDYIRVDVADQGPGMTEEVRARLFRKFEQGARRSKGIGLGLYISREIVERHGGSIWVESEPGRGTRFSFRIPTPL